MYVLEVVTPLPDGLRFFTVGWWVIHLLGVVLVFAWGYRKGRMDERRERDRAARAAAPQSTTR